MGGPGCGSAAGGVRVRAFQASDIDWALSIAAASPDGPQWPRQRYEELLSMTSPAGVRRIALVIAVDASSAFVSPMPDPGSAATEAVQGFAVASVLGAVAESELEGIAVNPKARNQGLGSRLLQSLLLLAAECGAAVMRLEVRASNDVAISFYQAHGFRPSGRRPGYYRNPPADALLFERWL